MEWTESLRLCSKVLRLLLVFNPVEIELIHGEKVREVQCLGQCCFTLGMEAVSTVSVGSVLE